MIVSVIECVNMKSNAREWQMFCNELESSNLELSLQTPFLEIGLINDVYQMNASTFRLKPIRLFLLFLA